MAAQAALAELRRDLVDHRWIAAEQHMGAAGIELQSGARLELASRQRLSQTPRKQPGLRLAANAYDACNGADALIIVTEWNEFRRLDLERIKGLLKRPLLIDMKNIYAPERVAALGFRYHGVGRPAESGAGSPTAGATE